MSIPDIGSRYVRLVTSTFESQADTHCTCTNPTHTVLLGLVQDSVSVSDTVGQPLPG